MVDVGQSVALGKPTWNEVSKVVTPPLERRDKPLERRDNYGKVVSGPTRGIGYTVTNVDTGERVTHETAPTLVGPGYRGGFGENAPNASLVKGGVGHVSPKGEVTPVAAPARQINSALQSSLGGNQYGGSMRELAKQNPGMAALMAKPAMELTAAERTKLQEYAVGVTRDYTSSNYRPSVAELEQGVKEGKFSLYSGPVKDFQGGIVLEQGGFEPLLGGQTEIVYMPKTGIASVVGPWFAGQAFQPEWSAPEKPSANFTTTSGQNVYAEKGKLFDVGAMNAAPVSPGFWSAGTSPVKTGNAPLPSSLELMLQHPFAGGLLEEKKWPTRTDLGGGVVKAGYLPPVFSSQAEARAVSAKSGITWYDVSRETGPQANLEDTFLGFGLVKGWGETSERIARYDLAPRIGMAPAESLGAVTRAFAAPFSIIDSAAEIGFGVAGFAKAEAPMVYEHRIMRGLPGVAEGAVATFGLAVGGGAFGASENVFKRLAWNVGVKSIGLGGLSAYSEAQRPNQAPETFWPRVLGAFTGGALMLPLMEGKAGLFLGTVKSGEGVPVWGGLYAKLGERAQPLFGVSPQKGFAIRLPKEPFGGLAPSEGAVGALERSFLLKHGELHYPSTTTPVVTVPAEGERLALGMDIARAALKETGLFEFETPPRYAMPKEFSIKAESGTEAGNLILTEFAKELAVRRQGIFRSPIEFEIGGSTSKQLQVSKPGEIIVKDVDWHIREPGLVNKLPGMKFGTMEAEALTLEIGGRLSKAETIKFAAPEGAPIGSPKTVVYRLKGGEWVKRVEVLGSSSGMAEGKQPWGFRPQPSTRAGRVPITRLSMEHIGATEGLLKTTEEGFSPEAWRMKDIFRGFTQRRTFLEGMKERAGESTGVMKGIREARLKEAQAVNKLFEEKLPAFKEGQAAHEAGERVTLFKQGSRMPSFKDLVKVYDLSRLTARVSTPSSHVPRSQPSSVRSSSAPSSRMPSMSSFLPSSPSKYSSYSYPSSASSRSPSSSSSSSSASSSGSSSSASSSSFYYRFFQPPNKPPVKEGGGGGAGGIGAGARFGFGRLRFAGKYVPNKLSELFGGKEGTPRSFKPAKAVSGRAMALAPVKFPVFKLRKKRQWP